MKPIQVSNRKWTDEALPLVLRRKLLHEELTQVLSGKAQAAQRPGAEDARHAAAGPANAGAEPKANTGT